jgi:hypothetical protein
MHALGWTRLRTLGEALADPLEGVQIDQDIGQGVVIGNGQAIAELGTLDPQGNSLTVDTFGGRALLLDLLVHLAIAVDLVAYPCPLAGGQGCDTAIHGRALGERGDIDREGIWEGKGVTTRRMQHVLVTARLVDLGDSDL